MIHAFTRHLRSYQPSVIRIIPWWSYPVVAAVVFFAVGASATPTGALALRAEPASSLVASRIDHLAGVGR